MDRKLLVLFMACTLGYCRAQDGPQPPDVWKQFRQTYPFHAQLIALTRPDAAGHRTMILSEPPPHVTLEGLKSVMGPAALNFQLEKQPIGADGWVKDMVVDLDTMPDARVNELVSAVHWYAFGTTYKASALMLPATVVAERPKVDLSFTMSDLEDHILSSQELFSNPGTGLGQTVNSLLQARKPGLFYSSKPGALVWIVRRGSDLTAAGKTIRRFALDSDLILGAAASDTYVAIVARERSIPIEVLPPLRTETILLLASAEGTQLSQSYERNYVYAGKVAANVDWAPIYLSPELVDTEYGSLLNITDQLLKSWSESGKVSYVRFKYPRPAIAFPFPDGLYRDAHVSEVTYNWNTSGFGYVVKRAAMETFAVNRTGALPVSYITGSDSILHQKEETGYDFFASTNDPNLARVVQYGALYQIFRRYKITAPKGRTTSDDLPGAELVASLQAKLTDALDLDTSAREQRALSSYPAEATEIREEYSEFRKFQRELREVQQEPSGLKMVAECMAAGRFTYDCMAHVPRTSHIPAVMALSSNVYFRQVVLKSADRIGVMEGRLARNKRDSGWIKTPSVVLSSNPGMQGGHNIGAKVYEFRTNPLLKEGEVRLVEENRHLVITLSEADRMKTSSILPLLRRAVEEGSGATGRDIEGMLERVQVARRPREVALGLPPDAARAPRTYQVRNTATPQAEAGYTLGGTPADPSLALNAERLGRLGPSLIISRESANNYTLIEPVKIAQAKLATRLADAQARDLEGVTELLADSFSERGFGVHLKGVTPQDALAFKKTMEFRIEAQTGQKVEINAFVQEDGALTEKSFATLAEREYDFGHGKIGTPEITVVEDGPVRGTRVDYHLEFRSVRASRPSLRVRIRLFFEEHLLLPARELLDAAVTTAIAKLESMIMHKLPVNSRLAMLEIKAELRKVCPRETDMHIELGDLYLVQLERRPKNDVSVREVG